MIITDTHAHIYSELFENDRIQMMNRALGKGVSRFFVPAIDSTYTKAMLDIEHLFPENVFLMMGLHPTHVKENVVEELAKVKKWLDKRNFYGVGEIGIDLFWDKNFLKQQQDAFKTQIEWAKEKKLPVIIHIRDSFDEVFEVLDDVKDEQLFGIFHCFTGTQVQAEKALSFNMKLGIGGVVTFKNGKIDQFLHEIDLKNIVLESDAPYLAPVPHRGKRNESSFLPFVVDKLSQIYKVSPEEIATITTQNSKDVFGI
ncbi:MAG: TatD family hydrolase [Flavobacteriaceae bacterium]|nr:TatD family hydrolase [Flavobacteriaceae bacterium]